MICYKFANSIFLPVLWIGVSFFPTQGTNLGSPHDQADKNRIQADEG